MKVFRIAMGIFFVFVFILLLQNLAKADDTPYVYLSIHSIDREGDEFVINGTVNAGGPVNRTGIIDAYELEVDIIIKNGTDSRYPNFKKWAYEPASIAAYYPDAETVYVPGTGPGNTMTREEAYGRNVTTIQLLYKNNIGTYNFEKRIPAEYAGRRFRVMATLEWDYRGTAAYWWAHRYFNHVAGEGILGGKYGFLYSYGVEFEYSSGSKDDRFCWKSSWPDDGNVSFKFNKENSYLAIPGGSLIGDESVSGKITKDKIIIKKNSSSIPLEYTSIWGHSLLYGSGEVSITVEMYDKDGNVIHVGWGNLTGNYLPSLDGNITIFDDIGRYIWKNKWEILRTTGGGLFISLTTGVPGFLFTLPVKYGSRALGYLWDGFEDYGIPKSNGEYNSLFKVSGTDVDVLYHSRGYVIFNGSYAKIYLAEGNASVTNATGMLNLSSGEFTVISNGSISTASTFNEDELKHQMAIVDTMWNESSFREEGKESKIMLGDVITCKGISGGMPADTTDSFGENDTVYIWVGLKNASYGDRVKWIFDGPNNISENIYFNVNWSGDGSCYAWLSLPYYPNSSGNWKTDIYINDKHAYTTYFTVSGKNDKKTPAFEFIGIIATMSIIILMRRRK